MATPAVARVDAYEVAEPRDTTRPPRRSSGARALFVLCLPTTQSKSIMTCCMFKDVNQEMETTGGPSSMRR
jgi:hypothetical protein